MRQVSPAPHGTRAIDDADHVELPQDRDQQRQGARQKATGERIQARESSRQIIERTGRFEPTAAAEFCHNTMAYFTGGVAEALDQVNVLVRAISLADLLETHEHFPNIIRSEAELRKYTHPPKCARWSLDFPQQNGALVRISTLLQQVRIELATPPGLALLLIAESGTQPGGCGKQA